MKPVPPVIIVDTREQTPFVFDGLVTERATLKQGDYSLKGYETVLAVERKSKSDAWASAIDGRQRFERCLGRLAELKRAAVVIEASMDDFCDPPPRIQRVTAASAIGSYLSWSCKFQLPVFWCPNKYYAERVTLRFLLAYLKHVEGNGNGNDK